MPFAVCNYSRVIWPDWLPGESSSTPVTKQPLMSHCHTVNITKTLIYNYYYILESQKSREDEMDLVSGNI